MRLKMKVYFFILPVLVGFFAAQLVNADYGAPGSSTNPVISRSYADKVLGPLREQVASLSEEITVLQQQSVVKPFDDVPATHWAYDSIMFMVDKGILKGTGPGYFSPDRPARRSEFAVIMVKALNLPVENTELNFKDVQTKHWAYSFIAAAQKAGLMSGYPDGTFKPDKEVTRGEMAVILVRAFGLEKTGTATEFSDVPSDYWAAEAILTLADNKITKGYEDRTFRPSLPVRRSEAAIFLAKSIDPSRREN